MKLWNSTYSRELLMQNFQYEPLAEGVPVWITKLPKLIVKEIDVWERECKKVKNHPLGYLKAHENFGYLFEGSGKKHNSYQCGIPPRLIDESYWLAYTMRLCSFIFGDDHRRYHLRRYIGHFDCYDIWANFAYEGNDNPVHNHAGNISGVIYHKNHNHPTHFPDYNSRYEGTNGTMIVFPSNTLHYVEPQKSRKERITFAFNINRYQ